MNMLDKIELLSKIKGIKNRHQLSTLTSIPYTTLDGLYKKGYENIRLPTLRTLASFFDVSMEYLVNDDLEVPRNNHGELGESQKQLMELARTIHDEDASAILDLYRSAKKLKDHI